MKVLWFTGLSGSGKTTISKALCIELVNFGKNVVMLDGDALRNGLCSDLGFSDGDRKENIRRAGEVAKLFYNQGHSVLCSFISPFEKDRELVRKMFPGDFIEIYVKCSFVACAGRDPKGLYSKALKNEIKLFTGMESRYEEPKNPEIVLETENKTVSECVGEVLTYLKGKYV
jgi:adenylylsulfate kinase